MAFDSAAAYGEFMGRYSRPLATQFADLLAIGRAPVRALDVGCGPGALTAELVQRIGAEQVTAVDPSEPFLAAVHRDHPGVRVDRATAEELPYEDGTFDLVLAQLVIHFMTDPVAGLAQLARVAAPGGIVAANVWDFGGHRGPLSPWAWGRQGTTWPRSTRRRAWRCADAVGTSFPPTRSRSALPLGQRCGTSRTDCTREVERAGTTRLT